MLIVKESDTHVVRFGVFESQGDTTGDQVMLDGAPVTLVVRPLKGRDLKSGFSGPEIEFEDVPVVNGWAEHTLTGTLKPSYYAATVSAVDADGKQTAPTKGALIFLVDPDLKDEVPA